MKKKTREEFIKEFKNSKDVEDYELLSDYVNAITKIKVKHKKCSTEYEVTPNKWLSGRRCPVCKYEIIKEKESISFDDAKKRIYGLSNNKYELIEYTGLKNKCIIKCVDCNKSKHIKIENRPYICSCNENNHINKIKSKKEAELINFCKENDYKLMSKYLGAREKCSILHNACNNVWEITPDNLKRGYGCPICNCNKSKGEDNISLILSNNNILFERQYKFDDCKNKRLLPFDLYLPNQKTCIEYNGKQHYEPSDFFGGEKTYLETIKRDKIKKEYCVENDINLITISYIDFNNIESILREVVNFERDCKLLT